MRICPHSETKNNEETVCLLQNRDVCNCIDVENYKEEEIDYVKVGKAVMRSDFISHELLGVDCCGMFHAVINGELSCNECGKSLLTAILEGKE